VEHPPTTTPYKGEGTYPPSPPPYYAMVEKGGQYLKKNFWQKFPKNLRMGNIQKKNFPKFFLKIREKL
jgi:hypothetical protein